MLIPEIFKNEEVIAAQSTRIDRVHSALNDDEERLLFFKTFGINETQVASSKQVHGKEVFIAREPGRVEGFDAIVTNQKNVFIMVATADCTPILIYDKLNKAVGAIHAGWRGTAAGIVAATLETMQKEFNTKGENCLAYIGACISERTFEVGEEVATLFDDDLKRYDPLNEKFFVDLKKANYRQLTNFGLHTGNIEVSEYCTIENNDMFYSYRKEKGKTGRTLSVIGMR